MKPFLITGVLGKPLAVAWAAPKPFQPGWLAVEAAASGHIRCATCDQYYPNPRCPNCRPETTDEP